MNAIKATFESKMDEKTKLISEVLRLVRAMANQNVPRPGDERKRLITKRNLL